MGRSNPQQILNNLASSQNNFAAGLGLCVQALAEATASAPVTPIMIEYRNGRMAFGRRSLARMGGHEAIIMAARLIYPQGTTPDPQRFVVEATLYTEDGRVDRGNRVSIYLGSWEELLPYIHSLYLRVEASPTSPRDEDRDRDRDNYRNRNKGKERERERPRRESSGLEGRDGHPQGARLGRRESQNEGYPPPA